MVEPLKVYASDTINYVEAHFDISGSWMDSDRTYAAWSVVGDSDIVRFTDIPDPGVVVVPQELLTIPGTLQMNLVSDDYKDHDNSTGILIGRKTSYPVDVLITRKTKV